MKTSTSLSPVDRACFNWSDTDCEKGAELFNVPKEAISKGLHGVACQKDSTSMLNFLLSSWYLAALLEAS